MRPVYMLLVILISISSCKNSYKDIELDYNRTYYPLEVGNTYIYNVDSLKFNPIFGGGKKWVYWELKEEVTEKFLDAEGRDAYRIERYIRKDSSYPWKPVKVWYTIQTDTRIERLEDNLRFIRLVFPAKTGTTWKGNAYINNDDSLAYYQGWNYEITSVDAPYVLDNQTYDSTLTVFEVDDENLLERRFSKTVFAEDTGIIYREQYNLRIVDSQIPNPELPWEEKANRGYILRMTLKHFE